MEKIRILCYGDSNTWGTIPDGSCRHCDIKKAYPALLQNKLGNNYQVISEGMPSRTTDLDDIKFPKGNRNGANFFPQCMISHDPLDIVILFLGTNDMKAKFNRTVEETALALKEKYLDYSKKYLADVLSKLPKFIIVTPTEIDEYKFDGYEGATEKSKQFNEIYKNLAKENDCFFIDNTQIEVGADGIHITENGHKILAEKLYDCIKRI